MVLHRADDGNGGQIRTIALTTFLTALTAMAGVCMTIAGGALAWGQSSRVERAAVVSEVLTRMDDRIRAQKEAYDEVFKRLDARIDNIKEQTTVLSVRIDRLEERK